MAQKQASDKAPSLSSIPNEIKLCVGDLLPNPVDVTHLAMVNKQFHYLLSDKALTQEAFCQLEGTHVDPWRPSALHAVIASDLPLDFIIKVMDIFLEVFQNAGSTACPLDGDFTAVSGTSFPPPLISAIRKGRLDVMEALIARGCDLNVTENGATALQVAMNGAHEDAALLLLRHLSVAELPTAVLYTSTGTAARLRMPHLLAAILGPISNSVTRNVCLETGVQSCTATPKLDGNREVINTLVAQGLDLTPSQSGTEPDPGDSCVTLALLHGCPENARIFWSHMAAAGHKEWMLDNPLSWMSATVRHDLNLPFTRWAYTLLHSLDNQSRQIQLEETWIKYGLQMPVVTRETFKFLGTFLHPRATLQRLGWYWDVASQTWRRRQN
ncbi:hypothetical protein JX265_010833 [Neoarthrinium moseri]|uniref:Ankyrin n=1 Tax=Neoarthrinium moseri TaxID=1658444 RepID=A0A9Q0AL50_9PEZI|nr:hypothetical protein JX266_011935 [Neoarthrinium moseri]KAI1858165.1 hypothetical protein JX265_010833 [Neoarthrinium moseri]